MRLSHIALTLITLLAASSVALASDDPIKVNISPKKHASMSAAIEVSTCTPSPIVVCNNDPNTASILIRDKQFGVWMQSEVASPTLDSAIASIKRMPNISLRSASQTSRTVVVWDRRL
jgi:hypothetical protein